MKARKFCIIALVLAMIMLITPISESKAEEEPEIKTSGDYEYYILDDGTACIKKYNGEDEKVIIPEKLDGINVTCLGDKAFYECKNLKEITIPDSVEKIDDNPFYVCENLLNINISADHPTLAFKDNALFYKPEKKIVSYLSASKESKYEIPDGIESIGNNAFSDCKNLTEIKIPDNVEKIDGNPFVGCGNLLNINISSNHPTLAFIDNALFYKPEKKIISYLRASKESKYEIPDGIESIGELSFFYCTNLTEIKIPESVQSIGDSAFLGCRNLTEINIPNSVQSIGEGAFSRCKNIKKINIPASVKTIGENAFKECDNIKITVAKDSYAEKYCQENNINHIYEDSWDWLKN